MKQNLITIIKISLEHIDNMLFPLGNINSTNASAMQLKLNIAGVSPLLNLFFASSISALQDQHCIKLALTTKLKNKTFSSSI